MLLDNIILLGAVGIQYALATTISPNSMAVSPNSTSNADKHYKHHHRNPPKCSKKTKSSCTYDSKGNTQVGFSGHAIDFGTFNPVEAVELLHSQCQDEACSSLTFHRPTKITGGQAYQSAVVEIGLSGDFSGRDTKDQLISALKAVTQKTVITKHVLAAGHVYPQHHHSSSFSVKIVGKGITSHMQVNTRIHFKHPAVDNTCSTFFDIADAVAGAVSDVAGPALTLLSLICLAA